MRTPIGEMATTAINAIDAINATNANSVWLGASPSGLTRTPSRAEFANLHSWETRESATTAATTGETDENDRPIDTSPPWWMFVEGPVRPTAYPSDEALDRVAAAAGPPCAAPGGEPLTKAQRHRERTGA